MNTKSLRTFGATAMAVILLVGSVSAQPATEKATASDGRLSWSAFQCSMYASIAGQPEKEFTRLFTLGYESGKRFLGGVLNGDISEAEVQKSVPVGLVWNAQGPTMDFRLGRIYEVSTQEAYDVVVKHDKNGLDLPIADWRMDTELRKSIAASEYQERNCALLK